MLILNATHRVSDSSRGEGHAGSSAAEDEEAGISTTNRTAPIVAAGPYIGERTIVVEAVARHGQLKPGGKSPH